MLESGKKYKMEKILGHIAVIRSLIWIVMISHFFHLDQIENGYPVFAALACTVYVIFTIYAYERFIDGLKFVSHPKFMINFCNPYFIIIFHIGKSWENDFISD